MAMVPVLQGESIYRKHPSCSSVTVTKGSNLNGSVFLRASRDLLVAITANRLALDATPLP